MSLNERDLNGLIEFFKEFNVNRVYSDVLIPESRFALSDVFVVRTKAGTLVFSNEDQMKMFANSRHELVHQGLSFDKRKAVISAGGVLLLDNDQPDFGLNEVPPSKEDIKKAALSKLSKQEREVLGL